MTISDWKRAVYAFLALPAYFAGVRAQRRLAERLLGVPAGRARPRYLAALVPSLVAFSLSLLLFFLVARIATYGLFWTGEDPEGTWGGPTLAGAWIVHFFVAVGLAVPIFCALRPLTRAQARLLTGTRRVSSKAVVLTT